MPSNPDPANSGRFSRPIDPPDLPRWAGSPTDAPAPARLAPAPMPESRSAEDETPTLSADEMPPIPTVPQSGPQTDPAPREPADPKELARRLAEEAKRRLAMAHGAHGNPPPATPEVAKAPPATPPARTPAGGHPGTEERAMSSDERPPAPPQDPRELARRLAEEAKRRMTPGPVPARGEPAAPEVRATPGPAPDRPLSERAVAGRPLSAAEALAAAREAERREREARAAAPAPPSAPAPAPVRPAQRTTPPPEPTPGPAAPRATAPANPAAIVLELLPGAEVEAPIAVTNVDVFRALWRAHRARALHEHDLPLVATASVLLDAVDRVPAGLLVAGRVTIAGTTWAVFADLDRKVVLACLRPPEVYLAGL